MFVLLIVEQLAQRSLLLWTALQQQHPVHVKCRSVMYRMWICDW
jgi:hypothetical protein